MNEHSPPTYSNTPTSGTKLKQQKSSSCPIRKITEMAQEFSVWCPAMRLDPCPPSVQRLLTPGRGGAGDGEASSPVFSLEPGTSCDPERVDLGLQPLLGTMVLASQVIFFVTTFKYKCLYSMLALVWYTEVERNALLKTVTSRSLSTMARVLLTQLLLLQVQPL